MEPPACKDRLPFCSAIFVNRVLTPLASASASLSKIEPLASTTKSPLAIFTAPSLSLLNATSPPVDTKRCRTPESAPVDVRLSTIREVLLDTANDPVAPAPLVTVASNTVI